MEVQAADEPPADAPGEEDFSYVPMSEWLDDLERK